MFVDDDVFDSELNNTVEHKQIIIGRPKGRKDIPTGIRKLAAQDAIAGGTSKEVQEAYGISSSQVSAFKHDATSTATYDKPDEELKKSNDSFREQVSGTARERLMMALEGITPDKINNAKLPVVSSVARDMSVIIKNMEPSTPAISIDNSKKVIVYRPTSKTEDDYDVIDATDE